MPISQYKEYQMYFNDNPFARDVQEIQMSQLLTMVSSYLGIKSNMSDSFVSKKYKKDRVKNTDISTATVEDINKLLGVTNG